MKKYLFGAFAVVLAVGAVAFTPAKFASGYRYNSTSTNITDVKNVSANWVYEATLPTSCQSGDVLPCTFIRDEDNSSFQSHLNSFPTVDAITNAADLKKGD